MRYLEVGGYYKTPRFPIWVIGSSSHFTVMFGDKAALEESASDALLEKVRRAFKGMDGGAENGFIQVQQLGQFLQAVDLQFSEHQVQTLAASMEVHGAGIILWEQLWKDTSRLLTGASLESVLQGNGNDGNAVSGISNTSQVPTAASFPKKDAPMSDEELARKLQAEWNGEVIDLTGSNDPPTRTATEHMPTASTTGSFSEQYGTEFRLYHYNGLHGGNFKPFLVTRLRADEAIGASVGLGVSSHPSHGNGDLEDVLRTKWPSCKINWLGRSPPSID